MDAKLEQFLRDESGAPVIKYGLIGHLGQAILRSARARAAALYVEPAAEVPKDKGVNHRSHDRGKAIKACEILFDGKTTHGMVLSQFHDGADVRLPRHLTNCPEFFTLKSAAGRTYKCRICWRVQDKIGVAFI